MPLRRYCFYSSIEADSLFKSYKNVICVWKCEIRQKIVLFFNLIGSIIWCSTKAHSFETLTNCSYVCVRVGYECIFVLFWEAFRACFHLKKIEFYFVFTKFSLLNFMIHCDLIHSFARETSVCVCVLVEGLIWYMHCTHVFIVLFLLSFLVRILFLYNLENQHLRIYGGGERVEKNGRFKIKWKKERMGLILRVFVFVCIYMYE